MIILLTGGVRCGKSALAARMIETYPGEKHYIATMRVQDEECARRVLLHRKARRGKGYIVHERPAGLEGISLPRGAYAVLDCLPNLLANEMFDDPAWMQEPAAAARSAAERILKGVSRLAEAAELLIVVSNDTARDGAEYAPAAAAYRQSLAYLNRETLRRADAAAELAAGLAIPLKGAAFFAKFGF